MRCIPTRSNSICTSSASKVILPFGRGDHGWLSNSDRRSVAERALRRRDTSGAGRFKAAHPRGDARLSVPERPGRRAARRHHRLGAERAGSPQRLDGAGTRFHPSSSHALRRRRGPGADAADVFARRRPPCLGARRRSRRQLAGRGRPGARSRLDSRVADRDHLVGIGSRLDPDEGRRRRRTGDFRPRRPRFRPGPAGVDRADRRQGGDRAAVLRSRSRRAAGLVTGRRPPRLRLRARRPRLRGGIHRQGPATDLARAIHKQG